MTCCKMSDEGASHMQLSYDVAGMKPSSTVLYVIHALAEEYEALEHRSHDISSQKHSERHARLLCEE